MATNWRAFWRHYHRGEEFACTLPIQLLWSVHGNSLGSQQIENIETMPRDRGAAEPIIAVQN
jgi:hypothetical protein